MSDMSRFTTEELDQLDQEVGEETAAICQIITAIALSGLTVEELLENFIATNTNIIRTMLAIEDRSVETQTILEDAVSCVFQLEAVYQSLKASKLIATESSVN